MARLAPGVYGADYRLKQKGQTLEMRSFLAMQDDDSFSGTSIVAASVKQGACTMTRDFEGVRLSGGKD